MVKARPWIQLLSLLCFVAAIADPTGVNYAKWLFQSDFATSGLGAFAARVAFLSLIFVAVLFVLTLFFGRIFCGWVCPMGSLIDGFDAISRRKVSFAEARSFKGYLFAAGLGAAAAGVSILWILDPLNWAARFGAALFAHRIELSLFLFFVVTFPIVSILLGRRGFCRVVCPVGASLAAVARYSRYRFDVGDECISCKSCVRECRGAAFEKKPEDHNRAECIHCRQCQGDCPVSAISFSYFRPARPETLPARRSFLWFLGGGFLLAFLARRIPVSANDENPKLCPPGAVDDSELTNRCIRCGACIRACPTGGIVPNQGGGDLRSFMTPVLSGRDGGCDYDCNACGNVCPTGAIESLALTEKRRLMIGLAELDKSRCLPHAKDTPCIACKAICPVDAILMTETGKVLPWGQTLNLPYVVTEKCIGCGLCEWVCPVGKDGAIRAKPRGKPFPLLENHLNDFS